MSDIRTCTADDIPAVARMFQKAFRDPAQAAPASLETYLRELFLEHPWRDPEAASRVFVGADGQVRGFIGVLPMRMSFHGQPVRAALASSLVVDNPAEHPLAGARLLRSYLGGPQELCVSETSNPIAQGMWERIGGRAIAEYSMEWLRPLKPVSLAVALAEERVGAARLLRPAAALTDRLIARFSPALAYPAPEMAGYYSGADVDDEALLEHIPQLAAHYALRPDWDRSSLGFFLRHAARKSRHGELFRRMVYGRNRAPVGCYLYYGCPRRIAWVLQVLALPEATNAVIADLLNHAERHGSVGVRGRTQPHLLDTLLRNRCVFFQRSSTTVYSSNADLLAAIRAGDAFIIGLAGEGWTRLIGERFA
jgi:ribosomal protein S18 acetylase RimI-like enzyme